MAWVENEPWEVEQGIDGLKIFELVDPSGDPYTFVGWDVNATISDERGGFIRNIIVQTEPSNGIVRLIIPEAIVNTLKADKSYRYDCLMVPPGANLADDNYLVASPLSVSLRTTRRDEP